MLQDLQLAGLNARTREAYLRAVRKLAEYFHTPPDRLSEQQVRVYFLHLQNDRKFAFGSLMIADSAIKFFYSHTAPRDWPTLRRLRVRNEKRLPDVLSVAEVRRLIAAVRQPLSPRLSCSPPSRRQAFPKSRGSALVPPGL
jgi:site-specific recombinase XerD